MNNKAQSAFTVILLLLIVGMVWLFGLSAWIAEVGQVAVTSDNLTGIDAFFYSNINLVIGFFWFVALAMTAKFGFG